MPTLDRPLAPILAEAIGRVLLGKEDAVLHAVTALLAGGHLLIEDRPGVGKTLLARALARSLDLPFQRVQCTADLLPSDILGGMVYHPATGDLTFRPGPVFTSILVADELNRTPPRTQSALLQCMQERIVTIDRHQHALPDPFFVVATQNPLTFAGTYPLPESQLDRFLLRIRLGYPDAETESRIVAGAEGHVALTGLQPVATADELRRAREQVAAVHVDPDLVAYVVALAQRTRAMADVRLGVSTRGAQALHRAAQARATALGRDHVVPDDVRELVGPVFGHRLQVRGGDTAVDAVLQELVHTVPVPQ